MEERSYAIAVMFHPSGVRVTIPLDPEGPTSEETGRVFMQGISNLLNAGWLPEMPGTNGEKFEVVTHVARREHTDGTPIVAFYSENSMLKKKLVHKYLNTPEDALGFENATGMRLGDLPLFEGDQFPDRDGSARGCRYVIKLPSPLKLVFAISDQWQKWHDNGGDGNEPQKRILLRYDAYAPQASHTITQACSGRTEVQNGETKGKTAVFKKNDWNLVQMIAKEMGLKNAKVAVILNKYAEPEVMKELAVELVKQHLNEEA